ncbi:FAD-dependent monooxygenase [Hirschia litorea]|uniref:FAD-dependent monooxygenase n=1 Tax=Hirschia litorea TaxID=1199156 RepID=A0ABW2IME5_9PROT
MRDNPHIFNGHEIIISGAGPVGLSLAIALCAHGFECLVVSKESVFDQKQGDFDGRAYTIAAGCWAMWDTFGICEKIQPFAQPIQKVEAEAASFAPLSFGFDDGQSEDRPLGYLIEAHSILSALWEKAQNTKGLSLVTNSQLSGIKTHADRVDVSWNGSEGGASARLLVGCDGRESYVRKAAGITFPGHDYKAKGLVATVSLKQPHNGVARQIFLKNGPFAVLPLPNNKASLVWTEREVVAEALTDLSDRDFELELKEKIGDFLGEFSLLGGRFAYPLKMRVADSFVSDRIALAGDAAHAIHPLAGQGLNLGLKDVASLAETIAKAAHVGLDIGSPLALEPYEEWRRTETINMATSMDLLERMFKAPPIFRGFAGLGMSLVGKSETARSALIKQASGCDGENTPQLFQGRLMQFS